MIGMAANRKTFWYAPYLGTEEAQDEYGNADGVRPVYGKPVRCKANITAAGGTVLHDLFGALKDYTHIIGPVKRSCAIDEQSILWVDTPPIIDPDDGTTTTPHDYVVRHVSESLSHKNIAIRQVNISVGGDDGCRL